MPTVIDENILLSYDPLALLRPIPGAGGAAGPPPDSEDAARINDRNAFIWLTSTREKAIALEEAQAGLAGDGERTAESESPARLWEKIFNVTQFYLRECGKDIRVALYCLEAWIRRDGLAGLACGLTLLRGLMAAYWETLHPLPRDAAAADGDRRLDCLAEYYACRDDVALDYSPLFFAMNRHVPVATNGKDIMRLCEAMADGVARPDPDLIPEKVRVAAAATPPATSAAWLAACRMAAEECAATERLAAELQLGKEENPFPSLARLRHRLEETRTLLAALYPHDAAAAGGAGEGTEAPGDAAEAESGAFNFPGLDRLLSQISGNRRSDNLRLLRTLGRHFQDAEPHSPVGYAVAHWAHMAELPLPRLLDEMGFTENGERMGLQVFAGVRAPEKK